MKKPELKIKFDKAKYLEKFNKRRKSLVSFMVVFFIAGMLAGSYYVLFLIGDSEATSAGEKRLKELDINFDKKTIEELESQQEPSTIQGPAGQNPFSPL